MNHPTSTPRWPRVCGAVMLAFALGGPATAFAQDQGGDELGSDDIELGTLVGAATGLSKAEAQRLLDTPLPNDAAARYALLQQQEAATRAINDRARQLEVLRLLAQAGRGQPGGDRWWLSLTGTEYAYGSQGRAIELLDQAVADTGLSVPVRAMLALNQAQYLALTRDRLRAQRTFSRATSLYQDARQTAPPGARQDELVCTYLAARSQMEMLEGNHAASTDTLREMLRASLAWMAARAPFHRPTAPDTEWQRARGQRDSARGLLPWALSRVGRYHEAILVSEAALADARSEGADPAALGRWHYRLAGALLHTRQYERSLQHATQAEQLLGGAGTSQLSKAALQARHERVMALIGLQRWMEADQAYDEFLRNAASDPVAYQAALNARLQALLAAKAGRPDAALTQIEAHIRFRQRTYGDKHALTREAKGVRGVIQLIAGNPRRAMSDYDDLFAALLDTPSGWTDLSPGGARGYTLNIALDEYLRYVAHTFKTEGKVDLRYAERALQVADRANLGVTHEALVDSTSRVLAATPALREALEAEQAQRRLMRDLFSQLTQIQAKYPRERDRDRDKEKTLSDEERKALLAQLKAQKEAVDAEIKAHRELIDRQQAVLNQLREGVAKAFPAYADLVTPSTPSAQQLASLLQPGEALLVVHSGDWGSMAWLVTPGARLGFAYTPRTDTEMAQAAREARQWLDLGSTPALAGTPPAAVLHTLYRELLAPFEAALQGVQSLIVATQGPLASVPFAALLSEPPRTGAAPAWLVRKLAVTQLPTASALQALRRVTGKTPASRALMGFGDPLFNPVQAAVAPAPIRHLVGGGGAGPRNLASYEAEQGFRYADIPPLPETRAELQALARALGADPASDLRLGAQASRQGVLDTDLRDRRVVAFATHGLMPGELPGVSKPALALAGTTAPGESPLLLLDDVLGLQLNAQWVLLSACNTAAGEQGGAAMSGLVRGFFFAGTRSVLATHWAVESASAAALVAATFHTPAAPSTAPPRSRAASLRDAQLALLDGQLGQGQWGHPFYWAPYSLFGDPSR